MANSIEVKLNKLIDALEKFTGQLDKGLDHNLPLEQRVARVENAIKGANGQLRIAIEDLKDEGGIGYA